VRAIAVSILVGALIIAGAILLTAAGETTPQQVTQVEYTFAPSPAVTWSPSECTSIGDPDCLWGS
jgi:hypothetical protein